MVGKTNHSPTRHQPKHLALQIASPPFNLFTLLIAHHLLVWIPPSQMHLYVNIRYIYTLKKLNEFDSVIRDYKQYFPPFHLSMWYLFSCRDVIINCIYYIYLDSSFSLQHCTCLLRRQIYWLIGLMLGKMWMYLHVLSVLYTLVPKVCQFFLLYFIENNHSSKITPRKLLCIFCKQLGMSFASLFWYLDKISTIHLWDFMIQVLCCFLTMLRMYYSANKF